LRAFLADGPVEAKTIQARAREAGIAEPTLRRAKARVGVEAFLTGFGAAGRWHWRLPLRRDDHEIIISGSDDHLWRGSEEEWTAGAPQPPRARGAQSKVLNVNR